MAPEKQPLKLYSHEDTPLFPGNVLSKEKIVFSSVCLSVCLSPSLSSVPWKHLNKEKKLPNKKAKGGFYEGRSEASGSQYLSFKT